MSGKFLGGHVPTHQGVQPTRLEQVQAWQSRSGIHEFRGRLQTRGQRVRGDRVMRFNEQQRYYQKNRERLLAKAKKDSRAKGVRSRDDAKAERAWKVHGSIWRLLAVHGPMRPSQIALKLGMTRMAAYNNLYAMTGVEKVGKPGTWGEWAALNVTEQ